MPAGKTAKSGADGDGGGGGVKTVKRGKNTTNNNNDEQSDKGNITNPNNPAHRTTFRPPWVKEEKNSTQAAPWTLNKRGSRDINAEDGPVGKITNSRINYLQDVSF